MGLSNNAEFYHKILGGIVLFFFMFLVLVLNVMRYEQLSRTKPLANIKEQPINDTFFSVVFDDMATKTPKLVLLFDFKDDRYYTSVLSFLKPENDVYLIDCAKGHLDILKSLLKDYFIHEEACKISENNIVKLFEQKNSVVIVSFKKNIKKHTNIMRAAMRAELKPNLKMMEIKDANKRL